MEENTQEPDHLAGTPNQVIIHEMPDGCFGIEAPQGASMRLIASLFHGLAEQDPSLQMDVDLSRRLGWTYFLGPQDALIQRRDEQKAEAEKNRPDAGAGFTERLRHWYEFGERGLSSETLADYAKAKHGEGSLPEDIDYPHDAGDLRRCRLLVEQVPEASPNQLPDLLDASPEWKAIAFEWDALCTRMDEECPEWRNPPRDARSRQVSQMLRSIVYPEVS